MNNLLNVSLNRNFTLKINVIAVPSPSFHLSKKSERKICKIFYPTAYHTFMYNSLFHRQIKQSYGQNKTPPLVLIPSKMNYFFKLVFFNISFFLNYPPTYASENRSDFLLQDFPTKLLHGYTSHLFHTLYMPRFLDPFSLNKCEKCK